MAKDNFEDRMAKYKKTEDKLFNMAKELWGMRLSDEQGIDNYYLDKFMSAYVKVFFGDIYNWFHEICEKLDKEQSFGDADFTWKILVNEEKKKVLYLDDHVNCGDITKAIIILDNTGFEEKFHIRKVWDKSDYKNINQKNKYVHAPGLKWYKDRGYSLEYKEQWHMGPLGGSYADCRDKGYVLTATRYSFMESAKDWKIEQWVMSNFNFLNFVVRNMTGALYELRNPED